MAVSNNLTAILNLVALLCSIPIISTGIWIASRPNNDCIRWLRWPLVSLGVAFLLVALAGFAGAHCKNEGLLGLYLVSMFILVVLLIALILLAFVVTRPDGAYYVPTAGFKEYRLEGFSSWLRDHVTDTDDWGRIRGCLADSAICPKLSRKYLSAAEFFAAHLSPIESGCCKPPILCGFQYSSPTMWVGPSNLVADADCAIWNNDPRQLCYDCDSCKAGLLGSLREEWRKIYVILIVSVIVLIFLYFVACAAYKNAQSQLFRRSK